MWPNHRKALYDMGITICLYFGMNKLHKKYWNTSIVNPGACLGIGKGGGAKSESLFFFFFFCFSIFQGGGASSKKS